jgi:ribosome-interacting GTPase 1
MPANLTPDYHRAEATFRAAKTVEEKIAALEEMLRVVPKHKGTDGLQADLKARLAKLRRQPEKKSARAAHSHMVPREGAGQIALVGPPNTGKSALVAALTRATPAVADYPFTTREAVPGMMVFEDIAFQLVDLPPVSSQHVEPWVFDLVRAADLLWLVVDADAPLVGFDEATAVLAARRVEIHPAGWPAEQGASAASRMAALVVCTGLDKPKAADAVEAFDELTEHRWPIHPVSSITGEGLDALRRRTFELLDIIRVYTKQPGKHADRDTPFTLPRGATVGDLAVRIHKDVAATMKFARVWGPSAFDGQSVHHEHVLAEGDVVEIHSA